jgi:di/tripeptidase
MVMYIDDGNIWVSSSSLKTNTQILQAAYKAISQKLTKSGLAIDTKKCKLIHFTRCKRDTNEKPLINIPNTQETNTTTILLSPHIKWLGIMFSSKLNFHKHIHRTALRAETTLGGLHMLGNTLRGLSAHHFRLLYTQTIRPIINYAAPTWAAGTKSQIKPLIKVQNKAQRLICAAFRSSPIYALMNDSFELWRVLIRGNMSGGELLVIDK